MATEKTQAACAVSPATFRQVMGTFATGIAVVTTSHRGEQFGMTLNSLTSVSVDPLIVLVCIVKNSHTGAAIRERGRFAINLLKQEHEDVSRRFVSKDLLRFKRPNADDNDWQMPLMDEALAQIVCDVHLVQEMGDHDVFYGRVLHCQAAEGHPLVYWRGAYATLQAPQAATR